MLGKKLKQLGNICVKKKYVSYFFNLDESHKSPAAECLKQTPNSDILRGFCQRF